MHTVIGCESESYRVTRCEVDAVYMYTTRFVGCIVSCVLYRVLFLFFFCTLLLAETIYELLYTPKSEREYGTLLNIC